MTAMMGLTTQNCSVAWRGDITIQEETKQTGKDTGGEEDEGGGGGVSAPNEMGHDSPVMAGVHASLLFFFFTNWFPTAKGFQCFFFLFQQLHLKNL